MRYAVEMIGKASGEQRVVVVELSTTELGDAAVQQRTGELVRQSYAVRRAERADPALMWSGGAIRLMQ
jgi:hypothetical protein